MKICIAGKNSISVAALRLLLNTFNKTDICVCPTLDDDGISGWQPSLLKFAREYKIDVFTIDDCYKIKDLIFFSLQYDQIIRPEKSQSKRFFNIHFSELPKYKGLSPITWAILNGEDKVGITLHEIDHGIDTGNIIDQEVIKVSERDTSRDIYLKCQEEGVKLFARNLESLLSNKYKSEPQKKTSSTYYKSYSLSPNAYQLNLRKTAFEIGCQVRAFSFREYQVPIIDSFPIREVITTSDRSTRKCGLTRKLLKDQLVLSTIDYDCLLIRDRSCELFEFSNNLDDFVLSELCGFGYSLNIKNRRGWTPLMIACFNGWSSAVRKLLEHGADPNEPNANGTVPIMYAKDRFCLDEDSTIIELLLRFHADLYREDFFGKNVFYYAEQEKQVKFIKHFKGY